MDCRFYSNNYLNSTKIVKDYLEHKGEIGNFFAYDNYTMAALKLRSQTITQELSGKILGKKREKLVEALLKFNERLGCSHQTFKNIEKLSNRQCQAVVTGQQAALLTGASFVIYKAITAILLALKLEEELKIPVVPIFWIASEDHDFLEVNNFYFYDEKNRIKKCSIKNPLPGLPPVGKIPVSEEVIQVIDQLACEFKNEKTLKLLAELKELSIDAAGLADFYGKIMTKFFREYGLIFYDPMLAELPPLMRTLGERVFTSFDKIISEINQTAQGLEEKGYEPVFKFAGKKQFPMFYEINGQREPIYIENNQASIGKNNPITMSTDALRLKYQEEPARFSPNAFLRPLQQDYLLPTIAYVAGPGEINYLAQLKGLYQLLQVKMPVIFPRARLTIISDNDYVYLQEKKISFPLMPEMVMYYKNNMLFAADGESLFAQVDFYQKQIFQEYDKIKNLSETYEPGLKKITEKNLGKIKYQLDYLKNKLWQAHQKKNKDILIKIDKIYNLLHPKGKEQEMVINIISLLELFGRELIPKLMEPELLKNIKEHKLAVIRSDDDGTS